MRRLLTDRQLGTTLAIGCSSGRRPLAAVFVTAILLLAASLALAAEPESLAPPPCETGQSSVVIAVPGPLDTPSQSLGDRCALFAAGSAYQRLDWLENGKVDGAILSPFALGLLGGKEAIAREFGVFPARMVPGQGEPFLHALRHRRQGVPQADPEGALLRSLTAGGEDAPVILESHLSDGLLHLVLAIQGRLGDDDGAWERLLGRLRFDIAPRHDDRGESSDFELVRVPADATVCDDPSTGCLNEDAESDYLVMRLASGLWDRKSETTLEIESWPELLGWPDTHPVVRFLGRNLEPHTLGSRTRRQFRFTVDELWTILGGDRAAEEDGGVSLVLTGGGVKAGYQTEVVDQLYGNGYLFNRLGRPAANSDRRLRVDSVVGTSGGALLGVFVAAIEDAGELPTTLVEAMWRPGGAYLDSTLIFPGIDMLRYASLLLAGVLFTIVCAVLVKFALTSLRRRSAGGDATSSPESPTTGWRWSLKRLSEAPAKRDSRPRDRWWRSTVPWLVLLGLAPWLIKWITGETGLEHVPAVSGIFYMAYALLAVYSDQRHVFEGQCPTASDIRRVVSLVVAGIALSLAAIFVDRGFELDIPELGVVTLATLIVSAGLMLMALAIHRSAAAAAKGLERLDLLAAAALLVSVPLLTYLILLPWPLSLFELQPMFWVWFTVVAVAVSVLLIGLASIDRVPARLRSVIRPGFEVLLRQHPARSLLGLRRLSRAMACLAFAWLYWNFVNAPALYGNRLGQEYFKTAMDAFLGSANDTKCNADLYTPLVITATSLGREREVYFLAEPGAAGALAARLEIASDPRWVSVGPAIDDAELRKLAFASGSPFPVFPMTKVTPPPIATSCPEELDEVALDPDAVVEDWLIDGGFAHNTPIDAARQLGARRVLVLNASPLPEPGPPPSGPSPNSIGQLVLGAPRLVPYLYGRSQVEDTLGTEDLLVGVIAPVVTEDVRWPLLVEFYPAMLERVITTARDNLAREARIGTVESWGQPLCTASGLRLPCAEHREAVRQPGLVVPDLGE
jgi:predicted acylesterase/phospholipase RssA